MNNYNIVKEKYKRVRKNNAINLPSEITQDMIPTYVVYYKECYNKEKNLYRDFFKIEKHPLLQKQIYTSSKSNKYTILEKLQQIKTILNNLELKTPTSSDIIENKELDSFEQVLLPKYIYIKKNQDNIYYLFYDKKNINNRETLKQLYDSNLSLHDNISQFINKINHKYNINTI